MTMPGSKVQHSAEEGPASMNHEIEDVRSFWDRLPLGADADVGELGTAEWAVELDRVKTKIGLAGVLDLFAPSYLSGTPVLDVGCGTGYWARLLIPRGATYHGVDISPRSVDIARRSVEARNLEASGLQVGNAERLEYPDGMFAHVISEGVIHHTPDTLACIREIYRVLRPGGTAAVSVYHRGLLLRSPTLFSLTQRAMRLLRVSVPGRERSRMSVAASPADFVRQYDGGENPIGRAYTTRELRLMFHAFTSVRLVRYFLPRIRAVERMPWWARAALARGVGLMVLVLARK